jgi:hypothetical protein
VIVLTASSVHGLDVFFDVESATRINDDRQTLSNTIHCLHHVHTQRNYLYCLHHCLDDCLGLCLLCMTDQCVGCTLQRFHRSHCWYSAAIVVVDVEQGVVVVVVHLVFEDDYMDASAADLVY